MSQPTLTEDDRSVLASFKELLIKFSTYSEEEKQREHEEHYKIFYPDEEDIPNINRCLETFLVMAKYSKELIESQDDIVLIRDWKWQLQQFFRHYNATNQPNQNSDILDISSSFQSVLGNLFIISSKLPKYTSRKFSNNSLGNSLAIIEEAKAALNHFVNTGKLIIGDSSFIGSVLDKLETLILNTNEVLEQDSDINGMKLNAEQSFIAIAAPSMEGKTQAAFTFRKVKPLYFPLAEALETTLVGDQITVPQPIYQNYKSLAFELRNCALLDLQSIAAVPSPSHISTSSFFAQNLETEFWTIGFLVELATRAQSFKAKDDATWMEHLAILDGVKYSKKSISQIPVNLFAKICLFLDEYKGEMWTVFVRNLARSINLKCICSNTNTEITNLIGKDTAGSGSNGRFIWSMVVVRLNSPSLKLLEEFFQLEKSIEIIKEASLFRLTKRNKTAEKLESPVCIFLNDFMKNQLKVLRPGAAVFIAKALKSFALKLNEKSRRIGLGELLNFVTFQLNLEFNGRKSSLYLTKEAMIAKIGLFLSESYFCVKSSNITLPELPEGFFNHYEFLKYHLYYLKNPQNSKNWFFLAFPPEVTVKGGMRIIENRKLKKWEAEFTHFEPDELFTILACQFFLFDRPVLQILSEAAAGISSDHRSVHNSQNPNAVKLPSNPLEVCSGVCIVDSSQHSFNFEMVDFSSLEDEKTLTGRMIKYSFSGQSGTSFIKNLIVNHLDEVISNDQLSFNFDKSTNYDLDKAFLSKCRIPYLYSMEHKVPLFELLSDESKFFVKSYGRCPDREEIDGLFDCLYMDKFVKVVVECKNWQKHIGTDKLQPILEKALVTPEAKLSLIFCKRMVEDPAYISSCTCYCESEKINVYRITRKSSKSFSIVPFFSESEIIQSNPAMICIIIETDQINDCGQVDAITQKLKNEL